MRFGCGWWCNMARVPVGNSAGAGAFSRIVNYSFAKQFPSARSQSHARCLMEAIPEPQHLKSRSLIALAAVDPPARFGIAH